MKLITKKLEKELAKYPLRSQENKEDPLCIAKYFNPYGAGTWYVTESEKQEDGNYLFFGYVELIFNEYGYFTLKELENLKVPIKINGKTIGYGKIERDLYFEPTRLSKITRGGMLNE